MFLSDDEYRTFVVATECLLSRLPEGKDKQLVRRISEQLKIEGDLIVFKPKEKTQLMELINKHLKDSTSAV